MKKHILNISLVLGLAVSGSFILSSCGGSSNAEDAANRLEELMEDMNSEPVSEKGNWTEEEMNRAISAVNEIRSQVEPVFGDKTQEFIDCYLEKVEASYENFATADSDVEGCTRLSEECANSVLAEMQ